MILLTQVHIEEGEPYMQVITAVEWLSLKVADWVLGAAPRSSNASGHNHPLQDSQIMGVIFRGAFVALVLVYLFVVVLSLLSDKI